MDDNRQVATGRDQSRQTMTGHDIADIEYSLPLEEVAALYDQAGTPRTLRSIQRYCANGTLDSVRQPTTYGDRYLVTRQSVERHIAQIKELSQTARIAASRDWPRPVASPVAPQTADNSNMAAEPPMTTDQSAAKAQVAQLEREVEHLNEDKEFLREQVRTKDEQIASLLERDRETNILVRGLQQMLTPLLGGGAKPHEQPREIRFDETRAIHRPDPTD